MAETKNNEQLDNKELQQTSGGSAGGIFSTYSKEEYEDAGVHVVEWGPVYNDGYVLMATGEELNFDEADDAVTFKKVHHYAPKRKAELQDF